ncbi:MAG: tRNA preQ1(34) S-adenosylmethionine ribosyltransferase-isomerase QueA [Clostridiales bacterium]|jgi:S-adenosylmethionine:tRNA ribosyltransferase-isomerase|nr:tRNA preQ1(34) S-adenosylmethionine ribosyltransferase-isomerase QueA [Clostridiales bacterium]
MKTKDFCYTLPQELIAQSPLEDRSSSRLMVADRMAGAISNRTFKDIVDYISQGDCLVINDTKVIPARLLGSRMEKGGPVELLLLSRKREDVWEALSKPGKRTKPGDRLSFGGGLLAADVLEIADDGKRLVKFSYSGIFEELLDSLGQMPLPPYIKETLKDKGRYQTVYARSDGSAAAPTAGLHFTDETLQAVKDKGASIASLTLHVGLGTFRPVKEEDIMSHQMHSEYYCLEEAQAEIINKAKRNGKKVMAVGTTSCRTLESCAGDDGMIRPSSGWTDIFIYPGYKFKATDSLITNFHLPESTLLMLVCALAGREFILKAYEEAISQRYRFFSFGDAMLII